MNGGVGSVTCRTVFKLHCHGEKSKKFKKTSLVRKYIPVLSLSRFTKTLFLNGVVPRWPAWESTKGGGVEQEKWCLALRVYAYLILRTTTSCRKWVWRNSRFCLYRALKAIIKNPDFIFKVRKILEGFGNSGCCRAKHKGWETGCQEMS